MKRVREDPMLKKINLLESELLELQKRNGVHGQGLENLAAAVHDMENLAGDNQGQNPFGIENENFDGNYVPNPPPQPPSPPPPQPPSLPPPPANES